MIQQIALGLLRHLLTTVAGGLVAQGVLTADESTMAVGAVMTLAGIGLSVASKVRVRPTGSAPAAALSLQPSPPGTTADDLNRAELDGIG